MSQKNDTKFLIDFMLGRLAKWLRIFGYDTVYARERNQPNILLQSLMENRVLVTRDHGLSRKKSWKLILVRSDRLADQVRQMIAEGEIEINQKRFFSRCSVCNGPVRQVGNKEEIKDMVPAHIFQTHNDFARCSTCGKVYWKGTHLELLIKDLAKAGIRINGQAKPC